MCLLDRIRAYCPPQRCIMSIMGALASFIVFAIRIPLFVGLLYIIQETKLPLVDEEHRPCPVANGSFVDHKFPILWSGKSFNYYYFSFYMGYVPIQIPAGVLSDKFGGKHVLGCSILGLSIITLITPFIVMGATNHNYLIIVRLVQGVFEAPVAPALNTLISQWIPPEEKVRITTLVFASAFLGGGLNLMLFSERSFYVLGTCGIIWSIIWQLTCFSSPEVHPYINYEEKRYIEKKLHLQISYGPKTIPLKAIFLCRPLWALIFAEVGFQWMWFTLVLAVPKYFIQVLSFNEENIEFFASFTFLKMWFIAIASGYASNRLTFNVTCARKFFTTVGAFSSVWLVVGSYFRCNKLGAYLAFSGSLGFMGCYYSGTKVNSLDLAPNFAGILMGVINFVAVSFGLWAPFFIEALIPNNSLHQWENIYWFTLFFVAFTIYVYLILGSAEEQAWNRQETMS